MPARTYSVSAEMRSALAICWRISADGFRRPRSIWLRYGLEMPACSESFRSDRRATRRCSRMNSPRSRMRSSSPCMATYDKRWRTSGGDGKQPLAQRHEHLGHVRVELRASHTRDLVGRVVDRERGPGRAIGGHGVECVDDAEHPRRQRDVLSLEALGVSRPVEHLVVVADDLAGRLEERDAGDHLVTDERMGPHDAPLGRGQRPWLAEDALGDADLAGV